MTASKQVQKPATKTESKQYFRHVPRRIVYGSLGLLVLVVALLFLCVPHYKPLTLASDDQINQAHHDIVNKYFLQSTICVHDNVDKTTRIQTFNKYFKVNKYANRAIIRGCNDNDALLAKAGDGQWVRTDVNIVANSRQNPVWQQACLIDDITVADTKVRPENSSIDANNLSICNALRKQSYVEINFKFGIHFHK